MELNQTSISYYDRRLARTATCNETADSIVPDTFPDIGRVVCAYGVASIKDQSPQNDRLLVSGVVKTTVVYQPEEGGGLRRLSIPISFAHIEDCEGLDANTVCYVQCSVAGIEATAVNSRKLSVNAQLCFEMDGYQKADCTVTESVSGTDIELMCKPCTVSLIEQTQVSQFTVLEDVNLPDAADLALLHTQCALRVSECRAMHGKVVLKGEAAITCLALQEDDAVRVLTSSTPFTQIIEMNDVSENDMVAARLSAREVDCRLEPDGLLSYTIGGSALFTVRRMQTLKNIDDLYIPGKQLHLKEEKVTIHTMPPTTQAMAEASETLQTAQRASHIISSTAVCCGVKQKEKDEAVLTTSVQILYLNEDQQLCSLQRTLPLTVSCTSRGVLSQVELNTRATPSGEQGIALAVSMTGQIAAESRCTFRNIDSYEVSESEGVNSGITLVLRFIDQEQPLWDIAKACGTTVNAIRQANELPSEAAAVSNTMLLIPIQS